MDYRFVLFCCLFVIAVPVVLTLILKPVTADKKARKNVRNCDSLMQRHCFRLKSGREETLEQLSVRNISDALKYSIDTGSLTICFTHMNASVAYRLSFYTVDSTTYMMVSRINFLSGKSNIPYLVNRFFIEKIEAEPIDYSAFKKIIPTMTI